MSPRNIAEWIAEYLCLTDRNDIAVVEDMITKGVEPPVAQPDESWADICSQDAFDELNQKLKIANAQIAELSAHNQAMREAIGKLPDDGRNAYTIAAYLIHACHAAAQPDSPRAKKIAERLAKAEADRDRMRKALSHIGHGCHEGDSTTVLGKIVASAKVALALTERLNQQPKESEGSDGK